MSENKKLTVIDQALNTIKELGELYDSDNIIYIDQLCNRLSTVSVNIGKMKCDAEKLFNSLKDDHDNLVEKRKLELIEGGEGVGKAESQAKVEVFEKKKQYRQAETGYEWLKTFLTRIDRVLDTNKQYVATVKDTNLKRL